MFYRVIFKKNTLYESISYDLITIYKNNKILNIYVSLFL